MTLDDRPRGFGRNVEPFGDLPVGELFDRHVVRVDRLAPCGACAGRARGLFEPALPLGLDKLAASLDEFAPSVPLSEGNGELGFKLVVDVLVVENDGVDVV